MRTTCSRLVTKILPSPILPVLAAFSIASITRSSSSALMATSIFTLGRKSTTYSAPRYSSVWPFCRPNPFTSVTVRPVTPMADNASRTSSSLNGLMIAVTNFMMPPESGQGKNGVVVCTAPAGHALKRLGNPHGGRALAQILAIRVGPETLFGIGVGVRHAEGHAGPQFAQLAHVVGCADLPVVVVGRGVTGGNELAVLLEVEGAPVRTQGQAGICNGQAAGQIDIVGIRGARADAKHRVAQIVGILDGEPFPAQRAVNLGCPGTRKRVRIRILATRVHVADRPHVIAEIPDGIAVAAVQVEFHAAAFVTLEIREPADVGAPGAQVETAAVRIVKTALNGRLTAGLRNAAEDIVAGESDIGSQRVRGSRLVGHREGGHAHQTGQYQGVCKFFHEFLLFE